MSTICNPLAVMRLRNDKGLRLGVLGATYGADVRIDQKTGRPRPHHGWDLHAIIGTPAFAIADGIVVWTRESGAYGKQLLLQFNRDGSSPTTSSDMTLYAFYCHLSEILAKAGQIVKGKTRIASTGISGKGDGAPNRNYPHLHFEIRTSPRMDIANVENGRVDPAIVLGGHLLSCSSEMIGTMDTVRMVCRVPQEPTAVVR